MSINIAVVSGKGGTGKSTVSSGLALAFAKQNKRVALIDLDIGLPCLDVFFGIEESVVFNLSDALENGIYENAIYYPPEFNNICVIPAPDKNSNFTPEQLSRFFSYIAGGFDVFIFDLPAGLNFSYVNGIENLKYICVSNSDPISVRDASVVQSCLFESGKKPLLILNKFNSSLAKSRIFKNIDDAIDASGIKLLGIVPYSSELLLLPATKKLPEKSKAFKALKRISRRLEGENISLPSPKKI